MVTVTSLIPVPLQDVWPHEAYDFTPWLAENLDALGGVLGLDLELVETEAQVGPFKVDILAKEGGTDRNVVIENQFGKTNHDHLGKVLTYAAGYNADVMVWVVEQFTDEHRLTLDWLNQRTDEDTQFYGVVIRTVKIGESDPAYVFELAAQPNRARKNVQSASSRVRPVKDGEKYQEFFHGVVDKLRENQVTYNTWGAKKQWQSFTAGIPKVKYILRFRMGYASVELLLREILESLAVHREAVEDSYGEKFEWGNERIWLARPGSINDSDDSLQATADWMVESVLKIRERVLPYVQEVADSVGQGDDDDVEDDENEE
ncbi:MAG: DUF4268 domain-containing protein [Chloroflexota bacterium]|nr:DUF4268 domain-containing protein [Chloroflexota bacterium]MDE2969123.1 DUF4268 domain-containing protein [Chloroflexota bacterium]